MFTGAVAASYYGIPRTTMDVDIVVRTSLKNVESQLVKPLRRAEIQVNESKIHEALKSGYRIVTFTDEKTHYTLDVILSDKKLERKSGTVAGLPSFIQTPEDLILTKLRMIKATLSEEKSHKDSEDVRAILKHTRLDLGMLKREARKENTASILDELIRQE